MNWSRPISTSVEAAELSVKALSGRSPRTGSNRPTLSINRRREGSSCRNLKVGVPIAISDMIVTKARNHRRVQASSKVGCRRTMPPSSRKLKAAGMPLLGKPIRRIAQGSSTEHSASTDHPTIRGYRARRAGRPRGGSAAAVAAFEAPARLGNLTIISGSICPAGLADCNKCRCCLTHAA